MKKWMRRIALALLALIVIGAGVWFGMRFWPARTVEASESLVARQANLDANYKNVNYTLANAPVIVNPYEISPLTALVLFKTPQAVPVTVTIHGKDALSSFSHTFQPSTEHRVPVYGLYPGQKTMVDIQAGRQQRTFAIEAGALPKDFPKTLSVKHDKSKLTDELYFVSQSSSRSKTAAYDVNGDVRWYVKPKLTTWEIQRLQNGRLLLGTERLVAEPYYSTGLYEMDLLGKIYREYSVPGGYHHDYHEMPNGNLIVATSNLDPGSRLTVEDYVVEIDRSTGKIVKKIDLGTILPMDKGKSLGAWTEDDWFHNNAVYYDAASGSLLLSGRHQDAVVNLDYATGKINYIIGSPEGWPADMQQYFLTPAGDNFEWQWEQHAVSMLPNGDIMLFDNGPNRSKNKADAVPAEKNYSRAVIYRVDAAARTITQVWEYGKERGNSYFSPYISDADYLGENHILVHSGGISYKNGKLQNIPALKAKSDTLRSFTTEVLNDEVVYEIETDVNDYRAQKMPAYLATDTELTLVKGARLGSLHETEKQAGSLPAWYEIRPLISPSYGSLNINFVRETDRLVMKGDFYENDVVRLFLKRHDVVLSYRVPMTNAIRSNAACLETPDSNLPRGDKKEITYYLNQAGLRGSYDIYLGVNGTVYDTNRKVTF